MFGAEGAAAASFCLAPWGLAALGLAGVLVFAMGEILLLDGMAFTISQTNLQLYS
ncbi:hypothetical protein D3C81_2134620 [compost metagenome]